MQKMFTPRSVLSPLDSNDFEEILEMYKQPNIHQYIPHLQNKTREEHIATLRNSLAYAQAEKGLGLWTVRSKDKGVLMGLVNLNLSSILDKIQIGAQFAPIFWGQGYGTETLKVLRDYGFDHLKLNNIYATVSKPHTRSQKMLTNIGMSFLEAIDLEDEKDVQVYHIQPKKLDK